MNSRCKWLPHISCHNVWLHTERRWAWPSGLGRWIWNLEVPGSNPPTYRYLDLFSVVPSSTPRPRCVNSQLVSLLPGGILNSLCSIWNICLFIYSKHIRHLNKVIIYYYYTLKETAKASAVDLLRLNTLEVRNALLTPKRYNEHPRPLCMGTRSPPGDKYGVSLNLPDIQRLSANVRILNH